MAGCVGGVAVPVDAMLSRLDVTALSRPSPTPSQWVARARNLRDAAARAEARNEASFSEWWRQSRDLRMAKASGAGSQRLSARERLDALRRRRSIPMRGAQECRFGCCMFSLPLAPLLSSSAANGVDKKKKEYNHCDEIFLKFWFSI